MNSKNHFENYYLSAKKSYSPSLLSFFQNVVVDKIPATPLTILDLGCGDFSIFEDISNLPDKSSVDAIDFSSNAIKNSPDSTINYQEKSILETQSFLKLKYDLIFDSHCLNCITNNDERVIAYENIFYTLKTGGIFASEMMVQPVGSKVAMPFKMILTATELEEEILKAGFKIKYFMISQNNVFSTMSNSEEIKCDLLRIMAQK